MATINVLKVCIPSSSCIHRMLLIPLISSLKMNRHHSDPELGPHPMNAAPAVVVSKVVPVPPQSVHLRAGNCPSWYCLFALMLRVEYASVRLVAWGTGRDALRRQPYQAPGTMCSAPFWLASLNWCNCLLEFAENRYPQGQSPSQCHRYFFLPCSLKST